ncbi:MAG: cytochrome c [Phycisphaeraceae bacterium]|nr:cytochrome c [Phycisphaeraceae bacterium]
MLIESIKDTLRDLRLPRPPFWMVAAAVVFVTASWIPLALIARARVTRSADLPVHIFLDMDKQPKFKAQQPSPIFADGRSMRPVIPGTVPYGEILDDPHYTQGYTLTTDTDSKPKAEYFQGFPQRVTVDQALLQRGRRQFDIMCSACHGYDGRGKGMVNQRAMELMAASALNSALPKTQWTAAADLAAVDPQTGKLKFGSELYPEGLLFNTLTHGRGNMPPLGVQIPIADRWAIVAYVRALQASQVVPVDQLSEDQKRMLENR